MDSMARGLAEVVALFVCVIWMALFFASSHRVWAGVAERVRLMMLMNAEAVSSRVPSTSPRAPCFLALMMRLTSSCVVGGSGVGLGVEGSVCEGFNGVG